MVDTVRTKDQLLTSLFQDGQVDGSITAQDVRDLIVSLSPSIAVGKFDTNALFSILSSGVFYPPASGTTSLVTSTDDMSMPQSGNIAYDGPVTRKFVLTLSLKASVTTNSQEITFRLTKNGVAIPGSEMPLTLGIGPDGGNVSIASGVDLATGDYIGIEAKNDTSDSDITITNGAISIVGGII